MLTIPRPAKRRVDGSVGPDESVRYLSSWKIGASALTRVAVVLLTSGLLLVLSTWSESGGISDTIPADWVAVTPGPGAEIVQFIKELPHDPNPLGLRAAHQRTKVPPGTFRAVRFSSVDGTPLGGMLGLSFSSDANASAWRGVGPRCHADDAPKVYR